MRYDNSIDTHIIATLSESSTSSFNELLKKVKESRRRRSMSRSVFTFHLNKLVNDRVISKHDKGLRGTRVYYFLTDYGKQQLRLYPSKEQEERERLDKIYQLLLFFVGEYHDKGISYRLDSEEDFNNFLSKMHISKSDLVVDSVRRSDSKGMYPIENKMYESKTVTEFRPIQGLEIWKEDHHQCTSFSLRAMTMGSPYEIRHKITYKITYNNQGKIVLKRIIKKEEKEEIAVGREKVKINDFSYYCYTLPVGGASVSDVVHHRRFVFEHAGLTHEEVREAFDLLKGMDIIRPTRVLFGEIRYSFNPAYEPLKELLSEYWRLLSYIFPKMRWIWDYVRKPTSEERKWLELFYGEKIAGKMLINAYYHRHSYRRGIKYGMSLGKMLKTFTDMSKEERHEVIQNTTIQEKEKIIKDLKKDLVISELDEDYVQLTISDFDKNIKKKIRELEERYADTIKKHHFPLKRLRDMIYPEYIQTASYKIK
jgi:DNA-binding HxlR family transcriptional regulator